MIRRVFLAVALVLVLVGRAPAQTVVASCGQQVKGFATLDADLDCTGYVGNAVTIHGGKLALNGHTLTGGTISVLCDHNCLISGPGTITGAAGIGVLGADAVVKIQSADVTDHGVSGIECVKLCTVYGPATISGNGTGIRGGTVVKVRGITVSGNDVGIDASNNDVRGHALVYDSTISGNGIGVSADILVKTSNSSITGNTTIGVHAGDGSCSRKGLATIKGGTITGNGTDPDCGTTVACADLATCGTAPHLAGGATCDHSYVNGSGIPGSDWNVCTLD